MVSGKPYISVNKAIRKAENAPNERQSRAVFGLVKLKANMINIAELMITSVHNPYSALPLIFFSTGLQLILLTLVTSTTMTMTVVHEQVHYNAA